MIQDEIKQLVEPILNEMGYVLWGCEYINHGKSNKLRVYIDKSDGIGLEDCECASRQISAILDVEDPISSNYTLEISSPGIPRKLFYPWQYEENIGEQVQLKVYRPVAGKRNILGTIIAWRDDAVVIGFDDAEHTIPVSDIVKANLTV